MEETRMETIGELIDGLKSKTEYLRAVVVGDNMITDVSARVILPGAGILIYEDSLLSDLKTRLPENFHFLCRNYCRPKIVALFEEIDCIRSSPDGKLDEDALRKATNIASVLQFQLDIVKKLCKILDLPIKKFRFSPPTPTQPPSLPTTTQPP
jgi:hypothetical protein